MIQINDLKINANYRFYTQKYKIIGKYKSLSEHFIELSDVFIYLLDTDKFLFVEEFTTVDCKCLVDIEINDSDICTDHSDYYKNYSY